MSLFNMRTIVRAHLGRERVDVLLSVLAPLVIMIESAYANAWVFTSGRLGFDVASIMALGRGLFIEALVYVCFKLIRMFVDQGRWLVIPLPLLVGIVGMIVSAGCNLGWLFHSPEMQAALGLVVAFLPGWMADTFRIGLGLLFPVAVGLFALFDVRHLVEEALKSAHLDNRALYVHRAEMHRSAYLRSLKRASKKSQKEYDAITEADAQRMVDKAKQGDLTFGSDDLVKQITSSSVMRVTPVPTAPTKVLPQGGPPLPIKGQPQPLPIPGPRR